MGGWMEKYEWTNGWTNRWMQRSMEGWIGEWMDGSVNDLMNGTQVDR